MKTIKKGLKTYCELYWWNMGTKTLSFKGQLKDLLKEQNITFRKSKTDSEGIYNIHFKSAYGVSFKTKTTIYDFPHIAKQFIQMELVRMGDKSKLHVQGSWRPTVTVNF